jgi:hypothetical protein
MKESIRLKIGILIIIASLILVIIIIKLEKENIKQQNKIDSLEYVQKMKRISPVLKPFYVGIDGKYYQAK